MKIKFPERRMKDIEFVDAEKAIDKYFKNFKEYYSKGNKPQSNIHYFDNKDFTSLDSFENLVNQYDRNCELIFRNCKFNNHHYVGAQFSIVLPIINK